MNFNKTTGYAINVLHYMAANKTEKFSVTALQEKLNIPYSYLRQVMNNLSKSGFITGSTGRTGGFTLKKDISSIYLADIVEATEGLGSLNGCIMGIEVCPFDSKCAMHDHWKDARADILKVLKSTTLKTLIKNSKNKY
mgnify:CR=1 FL=1